MVPVGPGVPVASIGVYWARNYRASAYEIELLQSLASAADLALASVRAYDETRRAWTQAEKANRLKDEFLATLSHELRNPLNSIVGYSEVLLRSSEATNSSLVAQAASTINRNARTQAQLINDLLDLSRLQTGKFQMDLRPLSFASVVGDAVESVQKEVAQKEIRLDLNFTSESPTVYGDAVRLQQIVWNLVSNAVKFTPPGGRVSVSLSQEEGAAKLIVEDSGQGIDPEFLPYAFEMFRQADAGTTRRHGGLGIGLALVKQLTELHDGQVAAFSDGLGRGARFTLTLPLHAEPQTERPAIKAKTEDQLAGANILIVDDTQDSLAMLDALLTGEGARVETAANGEEALKLTAGTEYDLIISDISMPEMDGYEFLQKLRAGRPHYLKIPAIALTGFGREEDAEKARRVGFTTHLTKPLDFDQLLQLARVALRK
jgi:two-component system CheB/CheR fusion protein